CRDGGHPARAAERAVLRLHRRRGAADRAPRLRRASLSLGRSDLRAAARRHPRPARRSRPPPGRRWRPAVIALVALVLLAAPADESKYPAPLREFLSAKNKDGSPVLSENDHKALAALPDHTRNLLGAAADSVILGSAAHLK